jgi:hypothetical protein
MNTMSVPLKKWSVCEVDEALEKPATLCFSKKME